MASVIVDAAMKEVVQPVSLERRIADLEARVADREKAFWSRSPKTFWGSALGVFILAGAWIYPQVWNSEDQSLPRFVHRDILKTDVALGSMLAMSSSDDAGLASGGSPLLYERIKGLFSAQLLKDKKARSYIHDLSRSSQMQFSMDSVTFQKTEGPREPVSCLLARDKVLRQKVKVALPLLLSAGVVDKGEVFPQASEAGAYKENARELETLYGQTIDNWCKQAAGDGGLVSSPRGQSPLLLTYRAKKGDVAILRIKTSATGEDGAGFKDAYKLVQYGLSDSVTDGELSPIKHEVMSKEVGLATIVLDPEGVEQQRYVSIQPNDWGRACLAGAALTADEIARGVPQPCGKQSFIISVVASISVEPEFKGADDDSP